MTAYSVFYCDSNRCSIHPVRAMDEEHAIAKVLTTHSGVQRVAVIADEELKQVNVPQLLKDWIRSGN